MFQDIAEPSIRIGKRGPFAWPLSVATHLLIVAILIIVPLFAPDVLPAPASDLIAFVSGDVILPAPDVPRPRQSPTPTPAVELRSNAAPVEAPSAITPEPVIEAAPPPGSIEDLGDISGAIVEGVAVLSPAPPAPAPTLRVGGDIKPPTKVKDVRPVYPTIAQAARVQGVVIIEATIGPAGSVLNAKVLRSIPLLDEAALQAVRQWEFTPTLLNGDPVPVLMTVTVNFTLNQ